MSREETYWRKAKGLAISFLKMLLISRALRPRLRTAIQELIQKIDAL